MRPFFHLAAMIQHHDLISLLNSRQPMRHHDRRSIAGQHLSSLLDQGLRFSIDGTGRLVEDQDPGIEHIRPDER